MRWAAEADCTITVLSRAYLDSEFCLAELYAALKRDPLGRRGQIIPVLAETVEIPSLLGPLAHLNLAGLDDDTARKRLMATLLKHGQSGTSKLPSVGRTRHEVEQAERNRSAMIEKVRTIWITGFLQKSLFHEARIILGLSERPDAVARPLDLLVRRPDGGDRPLPPGTGVVDVFDSMDHSLLILGAPGAGKTTLLQELARDLLDRAGRDPTHPIPVVFPLSTWAESRKPLSRWLTDELNLRYDVPRKIAEEWVASDGILPLLDGLDEVKGKHRDACVEAINAFRQTHGFLPLGITSRTGDYESLAEPLRLHGAILVRPLTHEQVNAYLNDLGTAGEPLRATIEEDPSLWELLDNPLMLSVVTVAYANRREGPSRTSESLPERRDRLFGSYVSQMLRRRAALSRYAPEQTVNLLSWLAHQMDRHSQSVFYLERLQLDWLPRKQRQSIRGSTILAGGLDMGLVGGLGVGLFNDHIMITLYDNINKNKPPEKIGWSWSRARRELPQGVAGGLVVGLGGGLVVRLSSALTFGEIETRLVPNEGIRRSARNALFVTMVVGLVLGLVGGLGVGLVAGLCFGPVFGLNAGMPAGGEVCLKHLVLRLWLIRNGSIPWNYVRFLNHASDRILLRKVGGGYAFIHRMLLEYFAARYVEPSAVNKASAESSSIEASS